MERILTFVPVRRDEAVGLSRGNAPTCPRQAFSATAELVAALGYSADQGEDAEYAAMVLASVWSLARFGERLVLVSELPEHLVGEGDEPDNGGVSISDLPAASVVAWFGEEPDAASLARRAAAEARQLDIDGAWELSSVQELVTQHDLLWHSADELGPVLGEGGR